MKYAVMPMTDYENICNAVREKTGKSELLKSGEIAESINEIYEAGKKAEYDKFWDSVQENGERTAYKQAFSGRSWTDVTFSPKYDIKVEGSAYAMFWLSGVTDLVGILNRNGVTLDFSACTDMQMVFHQTLVTELGVIDARSSTNCSQTFGANTTLTRIEKFILSSKATFANSPFQTARGLEHCIVEGEIANNGFSVAQSTLLDRESLLSIIACLVDKTSDTSGTKWVITLGTENLAKLTDAEKAIATEKGWTLA